MAWLSLHHFESDFGRRLIAYHLREDYGNVQTNNNRRTLQVASTTESALIMLEDDDNKIFILPFTQIYSDPATIIPGHQKSLHTFQNNFFIVHPDLSGQ